MRYENPYRKSHRSDNKQYYRWGIIIAILLGVIFFLKTNLHFGEDIPDANALRITGSGTIVITNKDGAKIDLDSTKENFFSESDMLFSVVTGTALLEKDGLKIWVDKGSDLDYLIGSGNLMSFIFPRGRGWVETPIPTVIQLKHFSATFSSGSVALIEQQRIHSVLYILKGNAKIQATTGQDFLLEAGNKVMISQSDLVNPGVNLNSLSEKIDETIQQNPFFLAHNGDAYFSSFNSESNSGAIMTGSSANNTLSSSGSQSKFISIIDPKDGSVIGSNTFGVSGTVIGNIIKKITINDRSAIINQNGLFSMPNITLNSDSMDIVYKGFDQDGSMIERGVITVYSNSKLPTASLIPTTFPISDKDFRIINPTENPYKTTSSAVTVSGVVPKGMVKYIVVNNFRLRKFVEFSTNWTYFANVKNDTMKEGFNLYEIKFYGANDNLLYTQLFTIIKEGENPVVSGE